MGSSGRGCVLCNHHTGRGIPVSSCGACHHLVCADHVRWHNDDWHCTKCIRTQRKKAARIAALAAG